MIILHRRRMTASPLIAHVAHEVHLPQIIVVFVLKADEWRQPLNMPSLS
jgi:hypothetical protein